MTTNELKTAILELPPINGDNFWAQKCSQLRQNILTKDPYGFLNWFEIKQTMNIGAGTEYTTEEEQIVATHKDWLIRINNIVENCYVFNKNVIRTNLIHQACHLVKFEQVSGKNIAETKSILEIGGGFGIMRLLLETIGMVKLYNIIDLPEFVLLQQFFLTNISKTILLSQWQKTQIQYDLLISMWGITEINDVQLRNQLADVQYNSCILGYQDILWEGVDNEEWIESWQAPKLSWYRESISRLGPHSTYCIGYQ